MIDIVLHTTDVKHIPLSFHRVIREEVRHRQFGAFFGCSLDYSGLLL